MRTRIKLIPRARQSSERNGAVAPKKVKSMSCKNFVLDTNILIHCPDAFLRFEENRVFVTQVTLEELDAKKSAPGETGYSAREAIRLLKSARGDGNLLAGVDLPGGGKLALIITETGTNSSLPAGWCPSKTDNIILLAVRSLGETLGEPVILVTNDCSMQLKADALGIPVEEYKNDRVSAKNRYTGRAEFFVPDGVLEQFSETGEIDLGPLGITFFPNEFLTLRNYTGGSMLARFEQKMAKKLVFQKKTPCGVVARNAGQRFLQEAFFLPTGKVPLVFCQGVAGSGKTLLALACGLEQVMEEHAYKRVLICRPNVAMDEGIGYLPGDESDKIAPLLRGCYDNLEVLFGNKEDTYREVEDKIRDLFDHGFIRAEALSFLRGRSIADTFVIIDEAQNTTPKQMHTIISRMGENSKLCVLGDPDQIDHPRLDRYNNGLVYAAEKMKESRLCAQVTFLEKECTRSPLAREAAEYLH